MKPDYLVYAVLVFCAISLAFLGLVVLGMVTSNIDCHSVGKVMICEQTENNK